MQKLGESMNLTYRKNFRNFMSVIGGEFGRRVLYTDEKLITADNIIQELEKVSDDFMFNQDAIGYLDRYYRGDQPALYRNKKVRPEINNKIVENHAYELVESKAADLYGEPIQYVISSSNEDDTKVDQLAELNRYMKSEDKAALDIERGRWASICGTSFFFIGEKNRMPVEFDEAPYFITVEDPRYTGIVYYSDDKTPAFSFHLVNRNNHDAYECYTATEFFVIQDGEIIERAVNGNKMIPVIEYPNNDRRLSDIEITITLTDELNKMQSDRMNGIEQFIQAFILFKNAAIDLETFKQMALEGAISIKDTNDNRKADATMMTSELSQDGTQLAKDDVYQNFLIIQGKPGRQEAAGSDTGQAVALRNGYYDEDKRAELRIPIFQKSERMTLRVILNKLRILKNFTLRISDIDIRPKRSKLENMMVKAQVLQILHQIGIDDAIAIKTINLFSDTQDVISKSKYRMEEQFLASNGLNNNQTETEVNEVEDGNAELRPTE